MNLRIASIVLAVATIGIGCSPGGTIPIVGLDNQDSFHQMLDRADYEEALGGSLSEIHNSMLPRLERLPSDMKWKLDSVNVGVVLVGEAGAGPVEVSGSIGVYLTFERHPPDGAYDQ